MAKYTPQEMIALSVVFMIMPLVAVALRAWAVRIRNGRFTADDYVVLAAMCCAMAVCITTICGVVYGGYGAHQKLGTNGQLVMDHTLETFYRSDWTIQVLSTLTVGLSKISVILLYRKIFAVSVFRIPSLIALAVTISWTVAFAIVTICQCHPVSLYWTELEFLWGDRCIQIIPFYEAQAITDILLDFMILTMPIPMIWNLQVSLKQKLAVASMFLLGLIASFSGIARIVVFFQVGSALVKDFTDITYLTSPIFIWNVVEASLSVTSACLPTLRPIFTRKSHFQGYGSSKYTMKGSRGTSSNRSAQAAGYQSSGSDQIESVSTVAQYAGRPVEMDRMEKQTGIVVESEIRTQLTVRR